MFRRRSVTGELHLFLTSCCNLKCPDCCMNIPESPFPEHYDAGYLKAAAEHLKGIDRLFVTGGEPTMHPEFRIIVPGLRDLFQCREMILCTNGYKVVEFSDLLEHFDSVLVSHYGHNGKEAEFVRDNFGDGRPEGPTLHVSKTRRAEKPVPCFRYREGIAYAYGLLYPCCVVHGPGGAGIPLTANWREDILKVPLPCGECCFAEEADSPGGLNLLNEINPAAAPEIRGVYADLWIPGEIKIGLSNPLLLRLGQRIMMRVTLESLAPEAIYPITLSVCSGGEEIGELTLYEPRIVTWEILLNVDTPASGGMTVNLISDKVFKPSESGKNSSDERELSVRILKLHLSPAQE